MPQKPESQDFPVQSSVFQGAGTLATARAAGDLANGSFGTYRQSVRWYPCQLDMGCMGIERMSLDVFLLKIDRWDTVCIHHLLRTDQQDSSRIPNHPR